VTKAVLGPTVFMIVDTLLKQDRIAVLIAQEKSIPFRRNCQTENLSLFASLRVATCGDSPKTVGKGLKQV